MTGTAHPAALDSRRRRFARYLLLGGLSMMGPIAIDTYLPSLPTIAREYGVHPSAVQVTLSACMIGLAAGQLISGPLSDTWGRRRPLLIGMAAFAVTSLLCAFSPSAPVLTVVRLFEGLGGAAGIVIAAAMVRDLYSGIAMARFFSLLMLVSGLGPVLAPVLGGQILRFTNWHGIFVALTLAGLVLLAGAALWLPETLPPERRRPGGLTRTLTAFWYLSRKREFLAPALTTGITTSVIFVYIAGSPFVLQVVFHTSPQVFSAIFAANAVGIMVVGQANGRLVGRIKPRHLFTVGLTTSFLGSVTLLSVLSRGHLWLPAVLVPLFVIVASVGLTSPNGNAMSLAHHPNLAGAAAALLGLFRFGAGAVVSPLVGVGGSRTAMPMGVMMVCLSILAPSVFFLLGAGRPRLAGQEAGEVL